jgi:hypothetical protein
MAHDVFISYAHEDKLTAGAVCAKLEEYRRTEQSGSNG